MIEHKPAALFLNFELLDHDYSLYGPDYFKNYNFGIENRGIFNTDPRKKKEISSLKLQLLKKEKVKRFH